MKTAAELRQLVTRIDHRSYPAYKDTKGMYQFPGYLLSIDHVQGDPFASPSRVSIQVKGKMAGFPEQLYRTKWQKTALEDALIRQFGQCCEKFGFKAKGSGKSGMISISRCGQEVLERSAAQIDEKQEISTFVWKWDFRQTEGRSMQENGSGSFLSFFQSVSKRHSTIKTVMRRDCRRSVIWQRTSRHFGTYCQSWDCVLLLQMDLFCRESQAFPPVR